MAQLINHLTLVMILLLSLFLEALAKSSLNIPQRRYDPQTIAYIKSSCQTTLYPKLCLRYLYKFVYSNIQSPAHLTHLALSVSLTRTIQTKNYLQHVAKQFDALKNSRNSRDYYDMQDCLTQINDSADELGNSIKELERLNKIHTSLINDNVLWHISNVETWVSTALTDASTCVDYFPGHRMSKMKAAIRGKVLNAEQVTSNALALFHRYATMYRAAAAAKKP